MNSITHQATDCPTGLSAPSRWPHRWLQLAFTLMISLALVGCGSTTTQKQGAGVGTILGASVGAGIGALVGGSDGALAGAGVGALIGGVGGHAWAMSVEKKREKYRSEAAHLDALIASAESVQGNAVALNRKLTAELEAHETQVAKLQSAGLAAEKTKAGLKREAKQVDKTTALATERSADLSKAIDQLKREVELKVQYIKYAEAEKRVEEARVTQLRDQIASLETQMAQLRASEQRLIQIRQQIAS